MTSRGAATRYARALFDVTQTEGKDLLQTQRDLGDFARLVAENESLQRVLTEPRDSRLTQARRRGTVDCPCRFASAGRRQAAADARRPRPPGHPARCRAGVRRQADGAPEGGQGADRHGRALPADRVAALTDGLQQATGRNVQVETRVDAGIIGGAVARIGGTVYDGSIRGSSNG